MTMKGLIAAAAVATAFAVPLATAQEDAWLHATSLHGEPLYAEGFERFDYVNPDAPKGGTVRLGAQGGFDTFNPLLPQGESAAGLGLVFETLMTSPMDEVSTHYGLLAEALRYPDDYSSVTFRMDPDARWHDGEPVTAEDVVWSFEKIVELSPFYRNYYANVASYEVSAPGEVTFTFDETGNRELPHIMGQLLVLPQHWWEGEGPNGEPRDISRSTLERPLGSGPYRIGNFVAGRSVTFERVEDHWAAEAPVNVGQYNFDQIRYEYFRDFTVQFEAFKGDQFDWWNENTARRWATGYDFPAISDGRVVRELFSEPYRTAGVWVGFVPNHRQERFQDWRVRRAINYAFDFEELNRTLFYGDYERVDSFFYGTDLRWEGLPEGLELDILEGVRDLIPETVFTEEYANPVGGDQGTLRANLAESLRLFNEAGYTLEGNQLIGPDGQPFGFEILLNGPLLEPIATHLQTNLGRIGVNVTVRTVDSPQHVNRVRSRDYDVMYGSWAQSLSPGNELRDYFGSVSADVDSSQNYFGLEDAGVDALIDRIIFATDREELEAASRALDRVLMHLNPGIPTYVYMQARTARWDRFSRPETLPEFAIGFPSIWWWDEEKAARVAGN